ncbi:MAG: hypothetical protein ACI8RD_004328 [Bacillariaceae sp.]|jgi:hypothetical protein
MLSSLMADPCSLKEILYDSITVVLWFGQILRSADVLQSSRARAS